MARSSLYDESISNKELDEKWIEVYEKDIQAAESFSNIEKVKYILVGLVLGLSINVADIIIKRKEDKERRSLNEITSGKT